MLHFSHKIKKHQPEKLNLIRFNTASVDTKLYAQRTHTHTLQHIGKFAQYNYLFT